MPAAATLVVQVLADVQNMQGNLRKGEMSLQSFARGASQVGKGMSTWVTLPIVAAGVAVTKMAMDFESQMTNVYTLMDEGTIKSRDWGAAVLAMSRETGEATDSLAKGFYDIVSSGFKATDALSLLKVSTKAAKAGMSDTATAVRAITATLNAYGMKASQAGKISDIMFQTVKYGVVTFEELAGSLGRVVGTAATANISFEEVGAAIATMTLGGLSAEESVIALNQTLLTFIKPSKEASELAAQLGIDFSATALSTKGLGGVMKDLIDKMGLSVDAIYEMEAAGNTEKQILDEMAVKAGLTSEQFAILFPNVRALKGVLMLARGEGENFNGMLDSMNNSAGVTEEAFSKIAETTQFQFDLALSSLKATGIELGTKFLPIASKAMNAISGMADGFSNLSDEAQGAILKFIGMVAVIGPLLFSWGKITTLVTGASKAITAFAAFSGLSAGAVGSLATILPFLAKGLNMSTLGFFDVARGTKDWGQAVNDLLQAITLNPVFYGKMIENIGNTIKEMVTGIRDGVRGATEETDIFGETIKTQTEDIMQYRFANEGLIMTLQQIEAEYANGLITQDQYGASVSFLADTNGAFKGTLVDVYSAVGILNSEQANAAKAAAEAQGAFQEEAKSAEELQKEIDDLMESVFRLYNLDQSVTEASWAYDDSLKALDKTMQNKKSTAREVEKAEMDAQDALEDYMISIKKELEAGDISAAKKKELSDKWVELGETAKKSGQAQSESFDELTKRLGININQNIIPDIYSMMGTMSSLDKTKADPDVTMNTSAFYGSLYGVQQALNSLGSTTVTPKVTAPRVPKGYIGGIPYYQHGGTVEGMIGEPKLAVVHGGEKILNPYEPDNFRSVLSSMFPEIGGPTIQNIFNIGELAVREEADVDRIAEQLYIKQKTLSRGQGVK